ncbi:hypothetical protein BHE74_00042671 [Ensete ventricosum]|nr:hypothetical protein GW17_00020218 [Ensete ventricosum]RWW51025.1 hypothetical protein BHE74_00042671 [Ensete ventricosum]
MLAMAITEGIMWLRKRMVVEAEAGVARVESNSSVADTGTGERIVATGSCDCGNGLEMAALGRGRRGVGAGTGQRREEKEEGSSEGLARTMVSPGPMASNCKKQRWLTVALMIAAAKMVRNYSKVAKMRAEEDDDDDDGKGDDNGVFFWDGVSVSSDIAREGEAFGISRRTWLRGRRRCGSALVCFHGESSVVPRRATSAPHDLTPVVRRMTSAPRAAAPLATRRLSRRCGSALVCFRRGRSVIRRRTTLAPRYLTPMGRRVTSAPRAVAPLATRRQ